MGTAQAENSIHGLASIPVILTIISLYFLLFIACLYQFAKSLAHPTSQAILRQRLFYFTIILICSCKFLFS